MSTEPIVHCRTDPAYWWRYHSLDWHARAWTGLDYEGHRTYTRIEGDLLRVQHGENPEASRLFTLDELNRVGGCHEDRHPVFTWCELIHAYRDYQDG